MSSRRLNPIDSSTEAILENPVSFARMLSQISRNKKFFQIHADFF